MTLDYHITQFLRAMRTLENTDLWNIFNDGALPHENPPLEELLNERGMVAVDWASINFAQKGQEVGGLSMESSLYRVCPEDAMSLPYAKKRIRFTTDMRKNLLSEFERTGLYPDDFFDALSEKPRSGVTCDLMNRWMKGAVYTVDKAMWMEILSLYEKYQDEVSVSPVQITQSTLGS